MRMSKQGYQYYEQTISTVLLHTWLVHTKVHLPKVPQCACHAGLLFVAEQWTIAVCSIDKYILWRQEFCCL